MKKLLALLLAGLLCFALCACSGSSKNEYDPSEGNVLITSDMINEIRNTVLENGEYGKLTYSFESDSLRAANARIGVSSGYEDVKEFTDIEISSEDYYDDWHYRFYGKIYGKDTYNNFISYDFSITIKCKENASSESGYVIERDGISINI